MKQATISLLMAAVVFTGAWAAGAEKINENGIMKLSGTIIDNQIGRASCRERV